MTWQLWPCCCSASVSVAVATRSRPCNIYRNILVNLGSDLVTMALLLFSRSFCGPVLWLLVQGLMQYPSNDRFNQSSLSVSMHEATCIFLYWSCKQVKLCVTFVLSCLAHFIVFFLFKLFYTIMICHQFDQRF